MKEAYIIDGIRTPIGSYQGTLAAVRTDDMAALVIEELIKRFTGYTIRTYELKDTGEEITIEDFIKNEITKTKPYM